MYWIHVIIVSIFLQALFINSIDANVIRRRRQQTPGSVYGNSNAAANLPSGYNYPSNTNFYGTNLNNQQSKDLYGNPMVPSNTGNSMNNMGLNNQQQPQQQPPLYGASGQSLSNPSFSGTGLFSASGTNPNMGIRDNSGNLMPAGSAGSSLYSPSNSPMGYPGNTNQILTNKDMYSGQTNTNNNQYGFNSNLLPNSNTYGGPMGSGSNTNNNLWSNMNPNPNPNNNNNNNQLNSNPGNNAWYPNRDLNANTNTNNNAYSNPNSPYFYNNNGNHIMASCLIIFLSFIVIYFFHI